MKLVLNLADGRELPATEAMTEEPYTVAPGTDLKAVVQEMRAHKYGCTIITDEQNHPVGIFTLSNALDPHNATGNASSRSQWPSKETARSSQ